MTASVSPSPRPTDVFTVLEVAAHLKISVNETYALIRAGRIKAVKISERRTRVTRRALDAYVVSLEVENMTGALSPDKLRLARLSGA